MAPHNRNTVELDVNLTWKKTILMFQSGRIGAEEDIDDFKGMSEVEIQELLEEREAKANAQILKMVSSGTDKEGILW